MQRLAAFCCRRLAVSGASTGSTCSSRWQLHHHHQRQQQQCRRLSLMDFFGNREDWGQITVPVGRPYRVADLRQKSAADLHKLWWLLIRERNALLTLQEEHYRCGEAFPNPERLEKVEETMENILLTVEERNRAVDELERGHSPGPELVDDVDQLYRPAVRLTQEHATPRHANPDFALRDTNHFFSTRNLALLRAEREKRIRSQVHEEREARLLENEKAYQDMLFKEENYR